MRHTKADWLKPVGSLGSPGALFNHAYRLFFSHTKSVTVTLRVTVTVTVTVTITGTGTVIVTVMGHSHSKAVFVQDAAAAEPDGTPTERPDFPGNKARQHSWQMQAVGAGIGPRGPFVLDLHGLSKPAAGLALQNVSSCVALSSPAALM